MKVVRRVPSSAVHLTFDDGPIPGATEKVLDSLAAHGARATFFVVVERARRERALLERIRREGHAVGNHSLDHRYRNFFRSDRGLREWIVRAQNELGDLLGEAPVGFRSPAGIQTPPLHRVLEALEIPLVHWNVRFFDAVFPFTEKRARRAVGRMAPGSIVLLHDAGVRLDALDVLLRGLALPAEALDAAKVRAALTGLPSGATVRA